jgi:hypothetical protein
MQDCLPTRFFGTRGTHKFEARYDLREPPAHSGLENMYFWSTVGEHEKPPQIPMRVKTYVRDVCVRCGQTIERVSKTEAV